MTRTRLTIALIVTVLLISPLTVTATPEAPTSSNPTITISGTTTGLNTTTADTLNLSLHHTTSYLQYKTIQNHIIKAQSIATIYHSTNDTRRDATYGVISTPSVSLFGAPLNPLAWLSVTDTAELIDDRTPNANATHKRTITTTVAGEQRPVALYKAHHDNVPVPLLVYISTYKTTNGNYNIILAAHQYNNGTTNERILNAFAKTQSLNN